MVGDVVEPFWIQEVNPGHHGHGIGIGVGIGRGGGGKGDPHGSSGGASVGLDGHVQGRGQGQGILQGDVVGPWMEPDEWFLSEARKVLRVTDKRTFWEMIRAVIELPELCNTLCATSSPAPSTSSSSGGHVAGGVGVGVGGAGGGPAMQILSIRNPRDLAAILKRPEYRLLWTADAAEHLPKDVTCALVASAYVIPFDK